MNIAKIVLIVAVGCVVWLVIVAIAEKFFGAEMKDVHQLLGYISFCWIVGKVSEKISDWIMP